jgi:hypothetical protein
MLGKQKKGTLRRTEPKGDLFQSASYKNRPACKFELAEIEKIVSLLIFTIAGTTKFYIFALRNPQG